MNSSLIYRWNSIVAHDDIVYHLGDFAMGDKTLWAQVIARLQGRKVLVRGNHDRSIEFMRGIGFDEVYDNIICEVNGVKAWLNHYPLESHDARDLKRPPAPGSYDIALCGHVHQSFKVKGGVVNVGVDVWNYRPVTLQEVIERRAQGDHT